MRKKPNVTITINFRAEDNGLIDWIESQARKRCLNLGNFSAVVRRCVEVVKEKNLLSKV